MEKLRQNRAVIKHFLFFILYLNNGRSNLASLVGELFKHLLYHRGQIPLNYNALLQVYTPI